MRERREIDESARAAPGVCVCVRGGRARRFIRDTVYTVRGVESRYDRFIDFPVSILYSFDFSCAAATFSTGNFRLSVVRETYTNSRKFNREFRGLNIRAARFVLKLFILVPLP